MDKTMYIDEFEVESMVIAPEGYSIEAEYQDEKVSMKVLGFGKVKRWKKILETGRTFGHYTQLEPLVSPDETPVLFPAFEDLDGAKNLKLMFEGKPLNIKLGGQQCLEL